MASVLQKLKEEGWFISDDGLKKLNENGTVNDVKELTKRALDFDLRELVTNGGLPNDISKSSKVDLSSNGVVVQIINIKNVSAPKANQDSKTSPRLLQIDMSDGQTVCSGLELEPLPSFNLNIAPGTKVLLRNTIKIIQSFLILTPQNCSILGGKVQTLYEKWETNRALSKFTNITGGGSKKVNETLKGTPPPWIPFGTKIKGAHENDSSFKSMNAAAKTKEISREENDFITARNAAIAEASAKGELRKQFGGNSRQLMDHNMKKILDKGYTEEQAKTALKIARNNLERAMNYLKKRNTESEPRKPRQTNDSGTGNSRRGNKSDDHPPAKPSGKLSLFDFLSDKIPNIESTAPSANATANTTNSNTNTRKTNTNNNNNNNSNNIGAKTHQNNNSNQSRTQSHHYSDNQHTSKFENNISSSFASRQRKDDGHSNRSKWNDHDHRSTNDHGPTNHSTYRDQQQSQQHQRSGNYYQQQQQQQHQQQQQQSSSHRMNQAKNTNQSKSQHVNNNIVHQTDKNAWNPSSDHSFPKHHNTKRPNSGANTKQQQQQQNTNMKNLIESTANMQISADNNKPQSSQKQNVPPGRPVASNFEEVFPEAKRFPYNPYKIMGFQNRETNEFAMNVLKTQMHEQKPIINNPKPNPNPNNVAGKSGIISGGGVGVGGGGQIKMNFNRNIQPQNIPIIPMPPQNVPAPKPNYVNVNVNVSAPVPAIFNMPTPPQATFVAWNFKIGDRCLAKYWEDEKYYDAEIQAVTDKTCVVHFLEYGNSEEVLHADCLPITDVNHQPINQYTNIAAATGQMHHPMQAAAYAHIPAGNKARTAPIYPPHHAR